MTDVRCLAGVALALLLAMAIAGCSGCEPETESVTPTQAEPVAPSAPREAKQHTAPVVRRIGGAAPIETRGERRPRRDARRDEGSADADRRLEDSDPEVRIQGVESVEPEGPGLRRLVRVLRDDPDPDVRIAAAEALESSDSRDAVDALVAALSDPNPDVVIAAIEALEFVGDERTIPQLARWRDHPDPEVREAVEDAIEFLE